MRDGMTEGTDRGTANRPLAGLTVLVVEDSRYASEAMRLLCLRSGARIRRADCLRSAQRHLATYRPGVVIVDMGLPDGNGAELIRLIGRMQPAPPVVLATSGDPDTRPAALAAGALGFLPKPITSLAAFQQAILATLPPEERPTGLRLIDDEDIAPDPEALRDDLAHVADVLSAAPDTAALDYIAQFLAGVARSAQDDALEDAARALALDQSAGRALAPDIARISGLVHDRLAAAGAAY